MSNWTPEEITALLRGETVVRWTPFLKQPPSDGLRMITVFHTKPESFAHFRANNGTRWNSPPAPHHPGDRVEIVEPRPTGACGQVVGMDGRRQRERMTVICTAVELEQREVRVMDSCPLCVCDPVATACANCMPTRLGWREEWRRDDE